MDYSITNEGQKVPFFKWTIPLCGPRVIKNNVIQDMVFTDIEKYGNFSLSCQPIGYYQVRNFKKKLDARISAAFPDFDGTIRFDFWMKIKRKKVYYFNMTFVGKYL